MRDRPPLLIIALLTLALAPAASPGPRDSAGTGHREAAITFDDLPVVSVTQLDAAARREITDKLLRAVVSNKVPAVGFVNEYGLYGFEREPGKRAPDQDAVSLLRMWLDAGLELGNHTFAHTDLHAASLSAFKQDIVRGEAVTGELMQQKGTRLRYFRHPYLHTGRDLATKEDLGSFLAEQGYRIAPVTVDSEDYLFAAAYSKAAEEGDRRLMRRIGAEYLRYTERVLDYSEGLSKTLFGREIRQVLLLHANALNADYFDGLARMMRKRGYQFVPLDEALSDDAYRSADRYTGGEGFNWLDRWAVTRGVKKAENALDAFPEVPGFVAKAAGI
jgi:peptidoglycan/xylan/chitin deacetylase (PgdA/CDA1 family)